MKFFPLENSSLYCFSSLIRSCSEGRRVRIERGIGRRIWDVLYEASAELGGYLELKKDRCVGVGSGQ